MDRDSHLIYESYQEKSYVGNTPAIKSLQYTAIDRNVYKVNVGDYIQIKNVESCEEEFLYKDKIVKVHNIIRLDKPQLFTRYYFRIQSLLSPNTFILIFVEDNIPVPEVNNLPEDQRQQAADMLNI